MARVEEARDDAGQFIREVWILQGVGYLVVMLRYLAHFLFRRAFAWDDFLMAVATVGLFPQPPSRWG